MVVFGFNDLGMHCMNQDFSKFMVLPPANNLNALVIRRGEEPQIITSGVQVNYSIIGNTKSSNKTNFWTYAQQLLGFAIPADKGLSGNGLSGQMKPLGDGRWQASYVPVTPVQDNGTTNPYQMAQLTVTQSGTTQTSTKFVAPVSWEISCNICHGGPQGPEMDILQKHDQLHGTHLVNQTPVACGSCHLQPPLAAVLPGQTGIENLSHAMHTSHAPRMAAANLAVSCYACHPGVQTQCLRDVHYSKGMNCYSCHGQMTDVANPARKPWVDEPRCGSCHNTAGHQYEEPGKLFRESRGHNGVYCEACHNTPHAIVPTVDAQDNAQNIALQGHAGTIDTCTVCHTSRPDDSFNHTLHD